MSNPEYGGVDPQESQDRRSRNRGSSTEWLQRLGVDIEIKNHGAHLIVTAPNSAKADFWPGTGKWKARDSQRYRRGVRGVIKWWTQNHIKDGAL